MDNAQGSSLVAGRFTTVVMLWHSADRWSLGLLDLRVLSSPHSGGGLFVSMSSCLCDLGNERSPAGRTNTVKRTIALCNV